MRVKCTVDEIELENDDGIIVPSVCVTCTRCDDEQESYGTSSASIKRCLVLLRENCSQDESNFYVAEDGQDE